ncbi:hypothetical protein MP228_012780 [Amoeboaphelidium protococcarum]|nr:hypothetical protein MP228_012780 [Amoeboaphelidium protococcarum]
MTVQNQLKESNDDQDAQLFKFDPKSQKSQLDAKPWLGDPEYFKHVHISASALVKMTTHAHSGGDIEVMGLMIGRVIGNSLVVLDSFSLPVEGTETRVNAQAEAYEYMVQYMEMYHQSGRMENVIGWYHSHPGYKCWLSGIDVTTQQLQQQFSEPYLAVVIDPKTTLSNAEGGRQKVEIGAFRTYPRDHHASSQSKSTTTATATSKKVQKQQYDNIPQDKLDDLGVYADKYYPLTISYFQSESDRVLLQHLDKENWLDNITVNPLFSADGHALKLVCEDINSIAAAIEDVTSCSQIESMERGNNTTYNPSMYTLLPHDISSTNVNQLASGGGSTHSSDKQSMERDNFSDNSLNQSTHLGRQQQQQQQKGLQSPQEKKSHSDQHNTKDSDSADNRALIQPHQSYVSQQLDQIQSRVKICQLKLQNALDAEQLKEDLFKNLV